MPDGTQAQGSQGTGNGYISGVVDGGFAVTTTGSDSVYVNESAYTYVSWCMKAGGAASSNSNGSITTSVSAADHGGFSVVSYTANDPASVSTIGHGLSRVPALILVKGLSSVSNWAVYSEAIGGGTHYLTLEQSAAAGTTANYWNNTDATSSLFTIGTGSSATNASGENYVAYCFAKTPGLIGIGSYTGNGSSDGPMVIVDDGASGFRPAWLMIKSTGSGNWNIVDAARDPFNQISDGLRANSSIAEFSGQAMDFIANGFKLRLSGADYNTSSQSYIYLAFADEPFNLARAR